MDRITTDKFDYCDVCKSRYYCTYYHGSMEGLCLEAEVYTQLREYERLGYSPAEVEALIREKKKTQSMTNGDKFRNMTDKEIADFVFEHVSCMFCPISTSECKRPCKEIWMDYLAQEAK